MSLAKGVDPVIVDGEEVVRVYSAPSGKQEHQLQVQCRECGKKFWTSRWRFLNIRPGGCKACGLKQSRRLGFGYIPSHRPRPI